MRTIKITVAGQSFSIKSDASEEHLATLALEVDERFKALKGKGGGRGDQDLAIMSMVAVMFLEELKSAEKKRSSFERAAFAFASKLISQIDGLLNREPV